MTSLLLIKSMLFANALQKSHKKKKKKIKKVQSIKKVNSILCRICKGEKGTIPIFNNIVHPKIPEEIKNFSGVTISKEENSSNYMCQSCLDLLNGCIMFRELCQKANKKMTVATVKKEPANYWSEKESGSATKRGGTDEMLGNKTTFLRKVTGGNIPKAIKRMTYDYETKKTSYYEEGSDENDYFTCNEPVFDENEIWGCSTCRKNFDSLASYNTHLSKCSSRALQREKPPEKKKFLCDVCGKTAFSNAGLLSHKVTHENIFPFKCEECPYQGRTLDLLKVHKRSHLADKPYKCTQCPKATTTSSNLAKHMRHVHSTTRPYKCFYCEKGFSYQHDMKRHIKDIHLRQGTAECDICFKKFNTKKILQGHRLKIHKIRGERQGRLPAYLQCQIEGQDNNDANDCEPPNEENNPY